MQQWEGYVVSMASQVTPQDSPSVTEITGNMDWTAEQDQDSLLKEFITMKSNDQKPAFKSLSVQMKRLVLHWDHMVMKDGVLYRKVKMNDEDNFQLVLPETKRNMGFKHLRDDMGHIGKEKTLSLVNNEK